MNFDEIKQLNEVRMSSSNLKQFLNSPRAEGMRSGFEAELCFRGMGETDYDNADWMNDYDVDQPTNSIDYIIEFFSENMHGSDLDRLKAKLTDDYLEWRAETSMDDFMKVAESEIKEYLEANEWDADAKIEEYLRDEMNLSDKRVAAAMASAKEHAGISSSKEQNRIRDEDKNYDNFLTASDAVYEKLDELVEEEIELYGEIFETVFEEFRDNDKYSDDSWLEDARLTWMSDIESNYDAYWPYQVPDPDSVQAGFSYEGASTLAGSLEHTLGVNTEVSMSYHGQTKDATSWYFEPDGSLVPDSDDDMPVEIVSPPMELKDTYAALPEFFAWVEDNDGYANDSTGFHMSLSMPDHDRNTVDYVKLALFLGDEHVLNLFGREGNGYCKSAMDIIRKRLAGSPNTEEKLSTAFDHMKKNLIHLAGKTINSVGGDKFVTIHDKGNYIEFRSAGGANYFDDIDRVQNTLLRYAYAMSIASDPEAEREEYAKKLYKVLSSAVQDTGDAMKYFIQYSTGNLDRSDLIKFIKQARTNREQAKNKPVPQPADQSTDSTAPSDNWPFPVYNREPAETPTLGGPNGERPLWPFPQGHRP